MKYPDEIPPGSANKGDDYRRFVIETVNRLPDGQRYLPEPADIKLVNGSHLSDFGIEVAKRRSVTESWYPSGIYAETGALYYIQGDYLVIAVFNKRALIDMHKAGQVDSYEMPTLQGFVLPRAEARRMSLNWIDVMDIDQIKLPL